MSQIQYTPTPPAVRRAEAAAIYRLLRAIEAASREMRETTPGSPQKESR